ncbi:uncharacterized protein LOC115886504 [Sitophilus oryzae]|uniref:Uncharacterized protein LOC115886504 n=1 Tax=Sitophilus oryzae TaxID=7048 RepID=A0A6J2YDV5_SITOR|nr:uncharacterized protein LOC115886504 [Sitophilus oryzae]
MDFFLDQQNVEEKEEKPKPFKLCFIEKNVLGQSNIKINKSLNIPPVVSLKFYNKRNEDIPEDLTEKYVHLLKNEPNKKKGSLPITESQKYGWYQVRLNDWDRSDRRLNFHKRTDVIVREHLMNYAKIRE